MADLPKVYNVSRDTSDTYPVFPEEIVEQIKVGEFIDYKNSVTSTYVGIYMCCQSVATSGTTGKTFVLVNNSKVYTAYYLKAGGHWQYGTSKTHGGTKLYHHNVYDPVNEIEFNFIDNSPTPITSSITGNQLSLRIAKCVNFSLWHNESGAGTAFFNPFLGSNNLGTRIYIFGWNSDGQFAGGSDDGESIPATSTFLSQNTTDTITDL